MKKIGLSREATLGVVGGLMCLGILMVMGLQQGWLRLPGVSRAVIFVVDQDNVRRHNDFSSERYAHFFGSNLSYEQWKKLPRGVATKPKTGTEAYVVSLTSWPPRTREGTPGIWVTIESLMRQTVQPDRIILWLSEEEYPGGDKELPQTLLDLQRRGLEIKWTPKNTKALKKLLPAMQAKIPANIITVDDDLVYNTQWLERLQTSHTTHPKALHANLAQYMPVQGGAMAPFQGSGQPYWDTKGVYDRHWFPECGGGTLFPYDPSGKTCYGLDGCVLTGAPAYVQGADDLWFYVCRVLAGTPFHLVGYKRQVSFREMRLAQPLYMTNIRYRGNDIVLRRLLKDFPEFAKKLGVDINKPQCVPPV